MTLPAGARDVRRVGGGYINEAFRVVLADGSDAFVKSRADAAPGEFAAEAAGLAWLAEPGALRTPRVLEVDDHYLALEWIASSPEGEPAAAGSLGDAGAEELGRGLAATHQAGAPCFGSRRGAAASAPAASAPAAGAPAAGVPAAGVPAAGVPASSAPAAGAPAAGVPASGAPASGASGGPRSKAGEPARFGWLRLSNEPAADWPTFYAERRLRPMALLARERGALSRSGAEAVEQVCERLGDLCGPAELPARLHGDLWSGNVMADAQGRPWLIDPSAYGGHREVDLAMLRLFGAPSERVFEAYEELAPLAEGWRERVQLYQLLPLLVHALLFGGSYGAAVERAASRYAG